MFPKALMKFNILSLFTKKIAILIYSFCQTNILKTCLTSLLLKDQFQTFSNHPASTYNGFFEWLHEFCHEHVFIFTMQISEKKVLTSHFKNGRLSHREDVQRELNLCIIWQCYSPRNIFHIPVDNNQYNSSMAIDQIIHTDIAKLFNLIWSEVILL